MSREWTYSNRDTNYEKTSTGVTIEWDALTGGYSWDGYALLSKMSGDVKLYASYISNGCSCYGFFDESPESYDFAWSPNLKEAAAEVSRAIRRADVDRYEQMTSDEKVTLLADLSRTVMKLR